MQAEQALAELIGAVDTVIVIPNERLMETVERGTSFFDAFRIADDILRQAVQGISDIITVPGIINRDFADVKAIMSGQGYAVMGTAVATGTNRAVDAANRAIASPLLEDNSIQGAQGILINITGSSSLTPAGSARSFSDHPESRARKRQHYFRRGAGRRHEGHHQDHGDRRRLPRSGGAQDAQRPSYLPKTWKAGREPEPTPNDRAATDQRRPAGGAKRQRSDSRSSRRRSRRAHILTPPGPKSLAQEKLCKALRFGFRGTSSLR